MAATGFDAGCYGESAFGHQYTREQCAALIELTSGPGALLRSLYADMSDDADEERLACDWLNLRAPLEGHSAPSATERTHPLCTNTSKKNSPS